VATSDLQGGQITTGSYIVKTLGTHVHSILCDIAEIAPEHVHGEKSHEVERVILNLFVYRHLVVPNVGEVFRVRHFAARLSPYSSFRIGAKEDSFATEAIARRERRPECQP